MALVRVANAYVDAQAPWAKFKAGKGAELEHSLYCLLEALRIVALGLAPFMPSTSEKMLRQLGFAESRFLDGRGQAAKGQSLPELLKWQKWHKEWTESPRAKGEGLFPRRDLATAAAG